jgi:hypothetical protein
MGEESMKCPECEGNVKNCPLAPYCECKYCRESGKVSFQNMIQIIVDMIRRFLKSI